MMGSWMNGSELGTSAMSRTSTMSRSALWNSAATAEPATTATTMPSAPSRVRCKPTIKMMVTVPTTTGANSALSRLKSRSNARITRLLPCAS